MQTTLLGLAIAIIVALVAAIVGPLMIDWGGYRALFEHEATQLIGTDVHITGAIDARLLPTPRLTLHDVEIGSNSGKLRARAFAVEFALAPLMRGQWQASELRLTGPRLALSLDAAGQLQAPKLAAGFDPDALTVDRLNISDGTLTLTDAASGGTVTLDQLWFNGDARSLLGPFRGEGAVTVAGALYPFRLSAGRYGDDGKLTLHVNVDPVAYPLNVRVDGALTLAGGAPRFDGSLNLTRPVVMAAGSKAGLSPPWHIGGKLKLTQASALMQDLQFHYGSEDKGFDLSGDADFKFGKQPRFEGVLSGRQIDLDSALAGDDGTQPPPAAAIRKIAELAGGAFRPAIPIRIGIGVDQVTLGGNAVQNLRGDISTQAQGWNLDRFEFRAPGATQVRLSGHLVVEEDRVAFTGPAELKTNNPKLLTAWLEGRAPADKGELRPLSLRGDLTLASDKIAVDRLAAEIDAKSLSGQFAYFFAAGDRPARLDATLKAPDLDLDAALGFGQALLAGSNVTRPHDMSIAADIGRATIAGVAARDLSARLKMDAGGLQIDKLSVADLGGAGFSASGRIVTEPSPQGSIRVDLNAPDTAPLLALVSRFAPQTARALERGAPAMAPAKLHAALTVQASTPATIAKLSVEGSIGKVALTLDGETHGELGELKAGDLQLAGKLSADNGRELVAMLGLDRVVAAASGPGALSFDARGPLRGDLKVEGRLTAGGLDAKVSGTASPLADSPTAALRAAIVRADFAPLRQVGHAALPASFSGRIALADNDLSLSEIEASAAGTRLRGMLGLTLTKPRRVRGEIEADDVDGAALIAAAIGMPATPAAKSAAWTWSDAPFAGGLFGDYTGSIAFKTRRAELLPQLSAREFSARLSLSPDTLAFDDVKGDLAGGRLTGRLSFHAAHDGLTAQAKLALAGADVQALLLAGPRPPITGRLALSAEAEGTGLSPIALVGSLHGAGDFALGNAQLAGLDPRAFDAVTHAVDQGLPIDAGRISDLVGKALQSGRLAVKHAEGTLELSAGELRLTKFSADSDAAKLTLEGGLDLTGGALDARLVLSGSSDATGSRPDIFMALKGPLTAPERSIDVSALAGWLTLRAVENQAKRLRELERERAAQPPAAAQPAPPSAAARKSEAPPAQAAPPGSAHPSLNNAAAPLGNARAAPNGAAPQPLTRKPRLAPTRAARPQQAPALPPPMTITPVPGPAAAPEFSAVGSQH